MSKAIITEQIIDQCNDCPYSRYYGAAKEKTPGVYCRLMRCTRCKPHKAIANGDAIPAWCPLPDKV